MKSKKLADIIFEVAFGATLLSIAGYIGYYRNINAKTEITHEDIIERVIQEGDLNHDGKLSTSELEYVLHKDKYPLEQKLLLANKPPVYHWDYGRTN